MTETFIEALTRHVRERPEAPALVDDRARLTWAEVSAWVEAAAGWLASRGLPRGAPVLGWLPNAAEWYLMRLASERAGLLWVPVPAAQGVREMASVAARVRPVLLVTPTRSRGRRYLLEADGVCAKAGIDPIRLAVLEDGLLTLAGPPAGPARATRLDEPAHALATTGSEGTPKLSVYTLAAAAERGHAHALLLRMTPDDVVLALSAGAGPGRTPWLAAPMAGATVIAVPIFRTEAALEAVERERATIVCGTPAQLAMLLPHLGRFEVAAVRLWYTAGSVLQVTLAEEIEARTNGIVLSVYGATDFGGWAAPDLDDPPVVRHRTVGRPRGGTDFRIVDHAGREVPPGESGEILGRGPCCVAGYLGDDALARERWRGGWFHTGDIGRFDERGNLVILGRARDLIIRGGENIGPEEVEALLRTQPEVAQVAVVGVPDPVLGERVCACVVPRAGTLPRLEALREHLRRQGLAHYKLPERLVIVPALPVVGDKIDRRAVAALAADEARV
ncbi:MAG: class I adenylate-forming enzyme family protein [Candidatus Methylomirabilia bacterium]